MERTGVNEQKQISDCCDEKYFNWNLKKDWIMSSPSELHIM